MGEFAHELSQRMGATAHSLESARASGDDYAVELHEAELLDLTRLASEHGLDLGGQQIDLTAVLDQVGAQPQPS